MKTPAAHLRIRSAAQSDRVALGLLYERAFDDTQGQAAIEGLLRSNGAWALIAEVPCLQGRLAVGFAIGATAADETELFSIGVDPDWRSIGVGRHLLTHFLSTAQENGATRAFLEAAVDNKGAIALYERCGFSNVGLRKAYYRRKDGKRIDAMLFRKDLIQSVIQT